uniref:Uncharacterized protein n=1 Tax=Romanomermis culicivorax TaxID=13658 RepID=A0A915KTR4_ROMCU
MDKTLQGIQLSFLLLDFFQYTPIFNFCKEKKPEKPHQIMQSMERHVPVSIFVAIVWAPASSAMDRFGTSRSGVSYFRASHFGEGCLVVPMFAVPNQTINSKSYSRVVNLNKSFIKKINVMD